MANFLVTARVPRYPEPVKVLITADNQTKARKIVEAMYKGCKIVSCVRK